MALGAIARGLRAHPALELARVVLFGPELYEIYTQTRQRLSTGE